MHCKAALQNYTMDCNANETTRVKVMQTWSRHRFIAPTITSNQISNRVVHNKIWAWLTKPFTSVEVQLRKCPGINMFNCARKINHEGRGGRQPRSPKPPIFQWLEAATTVTTVPCTAWFLASWNWVDVPIFSHQIHTWFQLDLQGRGQSQCPVARVRMQFFLAVLYVIWISYIYNIYI